MATIFDKKTIFKSEDYYAGGDEPDEPDGLCRKDSIIEKTLQLVKKSNAAPNRRLRLCTLVHIVLWLRKPSMKFPPEEYMDVTDDVNYWRSLALARAKQNDRFINVINLQKQRIEGLEKDLGILVDLAQDTQKVLAEISPAVGSDNSVS